MRKRIPALHAVFSALLVMAFLAAACQTLRPTTAPAPPGTAQVSPASTQPPAPPSTQESQPPEPATPAVEQALTSPVFAQFKEPAVQVEASVQQEAIAPDLSNVYNPFVLSPEQVQLLAQNGFVVTPGIEKEFFTLYEKARYDNLPVFVTSDSLLHSYHLLFDKVLRTAEKQHFIPLLRDLNAALLATSEAQYQSLKGSGWEEAALRQVAFVGVASRLLDSSVEIPDYAKDLVDAELAKISAAAGIQPSPIFPYYEYGEDYTQYIPRGHYTLSDDLKAYFKSMMWYGRMTFRLKTKDPEAGRAETRMALLLVQALRDTQVNGQPALQAWMDLYSPTVFFVGRSDDLMVTQYIDVMDRIYGPDAGLSDIANDSQLDAFIEEANKLPPPRILGMVINSNDPEELVTKGLRFMGQRFVPDAYIFRQLIFRNVSTPDNRRGLPKGLDLLAAMGSERAYSLLDQMGETQYANYPQQMDKMRTWLTGLSLQDWTETLYNSWLYSFYPLMDVPGQGYPAFMQSTAWLDKQLNSVLGSWAELKHDTILYAKQAYAEMGGGPPPPEPTPPQGYVEPVPEFYARLSALTNMTIDGLDQRGMLEDSDRASLKRLGELASAFQTMAEKELHGEALTDEEEQTIRFYGGDLEHFVMASADSDASDPFAQQYMEQEPQAAVVADVATDPDADFNGVPNPVVLEEGVGRINTIHVVVPVVQADGSTRLQIAKGGVFSYYEFPWPAEDRLTDEKWREMLDGDNPPSLPEWTASFFTKQGGNSLLLEGIQRYHQGLTYLYWSASSMLSPEGNLSPGYEIYQDLQPEIQSLQQAQQYMGHQLISANIASVDYSTSTQAVVSVRETWEDNLYKGIYADSGDQPISHRGPYTLTATYTLNQEASSGNWEVTKVTYDSQPPEWEKP